uniref:Uncharacterized protein n=1 Tax=Chromera velia CCMP2878 TaxID=1169474 RepID=A0A0G4I4H9_9ALVE|eukprot:Cvel_35776.t1-p1 / transcript=Cvel_35776.t1 / gene=Cvel_35776 / organism=Chromera_velia_CCMP2878 / gene_product=hypothetical protein / transcript_product=hypothetical protein / location=Cvel_scaffold6695:428-1015(+) / protein_length=196 / sequence_SO=supercontig / SO=protein_coding / is_pseudo=false
MPQAKAKAKAKAQVQPKAQAKAKPKAQPKAEPKAKAAPKPKAAQPKAKGRAKGAAKPKVQPKAKAAQAQQPDPPVQDVAAPQPPQAEPPQNDLPLLQARDQNALPNPQPEGAADVEMMDVDPLADGPVAAAVTNLNLGSDARSVRVTLQDLDPGVLMDLQRQGFQFRINKEGDLLPVAVEQAFARAPPPAATQQRF